jgi:hypothetical protein
MKSYSLNNQQGAVLAFTLVILLLLTLASISMIRQNKAQIAIATNAGLQVTAFASVETALRQTQVVLEALRYHDKANRHCKSGSTNSIHPIPHTSGTLAGLPAGITAEIHAEYCISNYAAGEGDEYQCFYNGSGVRNLTVGTPSPTTDNVDACQKLNSAGGIASGTTWVAGTANTNACQIEVYTLHVAFVDAIGSKRTVESKYEIDCSGDLNP